MFRINSCGFGCLDSRFRGNDGGEISVFLITYRNLKSRHSRTGGNPGRSVSVMSAFRETDESSFPRRRESRTRDGGNIQRLSENSEVLDSRFRGNDGGAVAVFPLTYRNLKSRHSRAGGNPGRSVSVMSEFRETDESSSPRRRESRNAGRRQYSKVV